MIAVNVSDYIDDHTYTDVSREVVQKQTVRNPTAAVIDDFKARFRSEALAPTAVITVASCVCIG